MKKLILTEDQKVVLKAPLENVVTGSATTVADLRKISKLCDAIEVEGETVEIEDADFDYLKARFTAFQGWVPEAQTRARVIAVADILDGQ